MRSITCYAFFLKLQSSYIHVTLGDGDWLTVADLPAVASRSGWAKRCARSPARRFSETRILLNTRYTWEYVLVVDR